MIYIYMMISRNCRETHLLLMSHMETIAHHYYTAHISYSPIRAIVIFLFVVVVVDDQDDDDDDEDAVCLSRQVCAQVVLREFCAH